MKKTSVLNSRISAGISTLGHFDMLTINDAGMPIPNDDRRVDVAITKGLPKFIDVLKNVLTEDQVQRVYLAEEIKKQNPKQLDAIKNLLSDDVEIVYIPHEELKKNLSNHKTKMNIRTGEITPYSNIALESGVTF